MFSVGGEGALHVLDDADAKGYVKSSRATDRYIPGSADRGLRSASNGGQAQRKKLLGTQEQLSGSFGRRGGGHSVLLRQISLSSDESSRAETCGDGVKNSAVPPKRIPKLTNMAKMYDSFEESYAAGQTEKRDRVKGGVASTSREAVACHYGGVSQGIRGEGSRNEVTSACGDKDASIQRQARNTPCLHGPLPTTTCPESTDVMEWAQGSRWGAP